MFNKFPPNIDPQVFSFLAVLIGSASIGNYNALEQNSIGNFLILVGQFILTNAAQQQLIDSRNNKNNNSMNYKNEIELLIEAINKIEQELQNIKDNYKS